MTIPGLTLIGESINDSIPTTHELLERQNIEGIQKLAIAQDAGGADYIDVNVGKRPAEFLAEVVRQVQRVTCKPLAIDTPDPALAEAALRAYDPCLSKGNAPILNSISPLRAQLFDLYRLRPFRPILMASERASGEGGEGLANTTGEEVHATARQLVAEAGRHAIPLHACIVDPAISPIGTDADGQLRRLMKALRLIRADRALGGIHISVGLSNFTVMLPPKRADGMPAKGPLENAFLTLAMPLGLDHVIGSIKRRYALLAEDHPALICLKDCLDREGFDVIVRIQEYCACEG